MYLKGTSDVSARKPRVTHMPGEILHELLALKARLAWQVRAVLARWLPGWVKSPCMDLDLHRATPAQFAYSTFR